MYTLQVEEMSCGHCVGAVTKALQALDPKAVVTVDLAAKTVAVDTAAALPDVRAAIVEAGYPVTSSVAS